MKHILSTAILAGASFVVLTAGAQAQQPVTANNGDLFLGFVATSGTGSSQDYLVDIGAATQFEGQSTQTTLSLGNLNADLASVFGAGYNSRSDLFVGVFGGNSANSSLAAGSTDPLNTLYVTKSVGSTAPTSGTNSTQRSTTAKYSSLLGAYVTNFNTQQQNQSTANSTKAEIQNTTDGNSYASFQTPVASNSFGLGYSNSSTFATGPTGASLELYALKPAVGAPAGTDLGTLSFDGSSNVTFTPTGFTPVPEPGAAWAMLPLAGLLGLARRRVVRA